MGATRIQVAALVPTADLRTRLREALGDRADVHVCTQVGQLLALARKSPADALVVEPWDASGVAVVSTMRELRGELPSTPILVYCPLTPASAREILELGRCGADGVVIHGIDDVRRVLTGTLRQLRAGRVAGEALAELGALVPGDVQPILAYCLRHGRSALTVARVARALKLTRRTLTNRTRAAGLPSPRALITWGRLLHAAWALEDGTRSVEQVAGALGFGSATAFRKMLRRYTGLRPGELRWQGGRRRLLDRMKRALTQSSLPRGYRSFPVRLLPGGRARV